MRCLRLLKSLYDRSITVREFASESGYSRIHAEYVLNLKKPLAEKIEAAFIAAMDAYGISRSGQFDIIEWDSPKAGRKPIVFKQVMDRARETGETSYRKLAMHLRTLRIHSLSASTLNNLARGRLRPRDYMKRAIISALAVLAPQALRETVGTDYDEIWHRPDEEKEAVLVKKEISMQLTQAYLEPEMLDHFGLRKDPFDDPAGEDEVYITPALKRIGRRLTTAVERQKFVAVIGKTGCGKSIIKKHYILKLAVRNSIRLCIVRSLKKEAVNAVHLQLAILKDLNPLARGSADHETLTRRLIDALAEEAENGRKVILVVEEAHGLRPDALRALKRLFEIAKDDPRFGYRKGIGICLVGQLALGYLLSTSYLAEVRRRITMIPFDSALSRSKAGRTFFRDAAPYLEFRLKNAANGRSRQVFDTRSLKAIASTDGCTTFLDVNVLAGRAMALAYDLGEKKVTRDIVEKAARP